MRQHSVSEVDACSHPIVTRATPVAQHREKQEPPVHYAPPSPSCSWEVATNYLELFYKSRQQTLLWMQRTFPAITENWLIKNPLAWRKRFFVLTDDKMTKLQAEQVFYQLYSDLYPDNSINEDCRLGHNTTK